MENAENRKSSLSQIFSVLIRSLGITLISGYVITLYNAYSLTGKFTLDIEIALILGPSIFSIPIGLAVSSLLLMVIQKLKPALILYEVVVYLICGLMFLGMGSELGLLN